MSTLASLRILLGLDSGDVAKGAGRVRGELRGVQVEANRSRDALRGVAAGFGLGAGLGTFQVASRVVSEFTDLIGDSVKAAIAEEAGIKRLDQSLRANIVGWDGNTAAIERTIAARQALGFADDEQRDALARALAATNDVAQAQSILATAMDLARFKGIDLASATDALIKVEAGQFRALKALGIELKAGATQTEALAAVQAVAAGQAQEFGKTTAGAMAAAGIEIDNLKEDFGALLAGPIKDLAIFIRTDVIPAIRELGDVVGTFGKILGDVDRELKIFSDFLNFIAGLSTDAGAAIHDAATSGFEFNMAGAAATAATTAWLDATRQLGNQLSDGTITQDAYNAAVAEADRLYREALAGASDLSKGLGDQRSEIDRGVQAWALHRDAVGEAGAATLDLTGVLGDLGVLAPPLTADMLKLGAGILAVGTAADDAGAGVDRLNAKLDGFVSNARASLDAFEAFGTAAGLETSNGGMSSGDFYIKGLQDEARLREEQERERKRLAAEALADSRQAASDRKRTADDAARQTERDTADAKRAQQEAWRDAQDAADQYFDRVHEGNRKAIDDIRDRRNAELDAANAAIQGAVDAEREKLNAIRDREREQELRGAVSAAESPEDLVSAQKDLQRFLQDQRVDFLQGRADAEIALNEAARENANAAADMAIAAEALRDIAARERFDPRVRTNADGTVASVNLADFENDSITINLFIDGEKVTEVVDRRQYGRRSARTPTSASTGSMQ